MELSQKKDEDSVREIIALAEKLGVSTREFSKHDLNMLSDNRPVQHTYMYHVMHVMYVCMYVCMYVLHIQFIITFCFKHQGFVLRAKPLHFEKVGELEQTDSYK